MTGCVRGRTPRQRLNASAACSTSIPAPSATRDAPALPAQPMNGVTGLHVAVQHNLPDVVRFFLDQGADVNQACHDDAPTPDPGHVYGETALHFAAAGADREIVEMLLAAGADRSARSSRGEPPQDYARRGERTEDVMRMLG